MTDTRPSENSDRPEFPMAKHLGLIPDSTPKEPIASIDPAERARNMLTTAESRAFTAEQRDRYIAEAHVHATLALVEAQKDANYLLGRIFDQMQATRAVGL